MSRPEEMLVRIRARPDTIYISQNRSVMASGRDGFITGRPDEGFFVHQTRLLSHYRYLLDGQPPSPNVLSAVTQQSWLGYYLAVAPGISAAKPDTGSGQVPAMSQSPVELRASRFVGDGMHEDLDLTNWALEPTTFVLSIEIDGDFADQAETRERIQTGRLEKSWDAARRLLTFDYRAEHRYKNQSEHGSATIHRALRVEVRNAGSEVRYADNRLSFDIHLEPQATWHACLDFTAMIDGETLAPIYSCRSFRGDSERDRKIQLFLTESTQFAAPGTDTLAPIVLGTLEQARRDLASLRLFDLDHGSRSWTVGAGLPLYNALYGRDALTTGWQAGIVAPDIMHGSLVEIAKRQGTEINDWRDEQPGKMLHEAHTGPLAMLNFNPRRLSYSSITTSGLFGFMLAELWHWTGDKERVRPLVEPALRALKWLEQYGDPDGDGFYEYQTRSSMGPRNQAWKDSEDAIVYEDGTLVEPPIATCEEQAFVYVAKLHLASVMWWLGERAMAKRLYEEASELKKRFNEAFWMEEEGFFAMALDAKKRQVRSIGSNPGHCVAAAIVDSSLVERMTDRLFEPDLFSGWGIRTLSSDHPRYNPYSYHLGSIWPVEHGTFALGFMRYGLHERTHQLARAQFEAAALFDFYRLPELFSGHPRDDGHPFPGIYPNANSPQAWSASAVFCFIQAMLGLYPYAPLRALLVDPHLPEWLPEITLRDLRIGKATVTIRFWRKKSGSSTYRILEQRGKLHVLRQPTPWSLTTKPAERVKDALESMLPGR